jgi:hypothetical protein
MLKQALHLALAVLQHRLQVALSGLTRPGRRGFGPVDG